MLKSKNTLKHEISVKTLEHKYRVSLVLLLYELMKNIKSIGPLGTLTILLLLLFKMFRRIGNMRSFKTH